jgi:predicted glycosyltransferase involved in capsule biosynthesis
VDRSTYLKYLSALFLKGHRFSIRLQNRSKRDASQNLDTASNFNDLTIVITTFQERFAVFTVPLLKAIRSVSNVPIILVINGNLTTLTDTDKLSLFLSEIAKYDQIYPVTFQSFQGCAKMWNTGIIHSRTSNVLILNDDVSIVSENFNSDLAESLKILPKTGILTFNSSWSHFLINRKTNLRFGWFDERYIGIGNEDGEYAERYTRMTGEYIPTLKADAFVNISDTSRDESVVPTESKYSLFNSVFNEIRNVSPEAISAVELYPLAEWQTSMTALLSETNKEIISTTIMSKLQELDTTED